MSIKTLTKIACSNLKTKQKRGLNILGVNPLLPTVPDCGWKATIFEENENVPLRFWDSLLRFECALVSCLVIAKNYFKQIHITSRILAYIWPMCKKYPIVHRILANTQI